MFWYIESLERFRTEKKALENLVGSVDWLQALGWRIDKELRIVFDADIRAGDRTYPVSLRYPAYFPHTPPGVWPRETRTRWSYHQFGAGGELCLEFGPDNWTPDVTGRQMIESAHRLLLGENPGPDEKGVVDTRHVTSLGQELRAEHVRFLSTRELEESLSQIQVGALVTAHLLCAFHKEQTIYLIDRLTFSDGTSVKNLGVPKLLSNELLEQRIQIFCVAPHSSLPSTDTFEQFSEDCLNLGFSTERLHVILLRDGKLHPYFIWNDSLFEMSLIPAQAEVARLDNGHARLKNKSVGLVGCGSLGSKIAGMLARAGVGSFVLVDDDILLPDNFVRNDLDWRDVGSHKVDAVARRIQFVNPTARTSTRKIQLGGQESAESAETLFNSLGECDLILDATANPEVLNLVSAISNASVKPVIWAEVFGGGIGGIIARSRPGIEPRPPYMRRAIDDWFRQRVSASITPRRGYEDGQTIGALIADDADVSAIAAHAARFAIDLLLERDPSSFPNSVYLMGLTKGSVFQQPFETYPIVVGDAPPEEEATPLTREETHEEIQKIRDLLVVMTNAPDPA